MVNDVNFLFHSELLFWVEVFVEVFVGGSARLHFISLTKPIFTTIKWIFLFLYYFIVWFHCFKYYIHHQIIIIQVIYTGFFQFVVNVSYFYGKMFCLCSRLLVWFFFKINGSGTFCTFWTILWRFDRFCKTLSLIFWSLISGAGIFNNSFIWWDSYRTIQAIPIPCKTWVRISSGINRHISSFVTKGHCLLLNNFKEVFGADGWT